MSWCVYIVKCSDNSLYTGVSSNLVSRIKKHNTGQGAKYTKTRRPVKLVYEEQLENKSISLKREMEIKKLSRDEKLKLINGFNFSSA